MPYNVVWQANDLVTCSLGHLTETFCLGLVLESVAWEVDTGSVNIGLDEDTDTSNTIKLHLDVLVETPVTVLGHVVATSLELLVTFMDVS